jgi:hypothetical protein
MVDDEKEHARRQWQRENRKVATFCKVVALGGNYDKNTPLI